MELSGPLRAVMIDVRLACERAAAEKRGTVVDLSDPEIFGGYFAAIREAGNAILERAAREGIVGVENCLCFTPTADDLADIDARNGFTAGVRKTGRDGETSIVHQFEIRVAGVLDADGDGA